MDIRRKILIDRMIGLACSRWATVIRAERARCRMGELSKEWEHRGRRGRKRAEIITHCN